MWQLQIKCQEPGVSHTLYSILDRVLIRQFHSLPQSPIVENSSAPQKYKQIFSHLECDTIHWRQQHEILENANMLPYDRLNPLQILQHLIKSNLWVNNDLPFANSIPGIWFIFCYRVKECVRVLKFMRLMTFNLKKKILVCPPPNMMRRSSLVVGCTQTHSYS